MLLQEHANAKLGEVNEVVPRTKEQAALNFDSISAVSYFKRFQKTAARPLFDCLLLKRFLPSSESESVPEWFFCKATRKLVSGRAGESKSRSRPRGIPPLVTAR